MPKTFPIIILSVILACQSKKDITQAQYDSAQTALNAVMEETSTSQLECGYDNPGSTLGIGLIIVPDTFRIFNDPLLSSLLEKVNMYDEPYTKICSRFYKPDYGLMHFVCVDSIQQAYRVLAGNEIKYLPNQSHYSFMPWEEYILTSFGIRRIENSKHELKEAPDPQAKSLALPEGHEMFCPIEIQGDWVKVKYDCFYNREENEFEGQPCHNFIDQCKSPLTGWLRWREGNQLLIDIFLMP